MNARVKLADHLARQHVLERDHYRCRACGRDGALEWAHIVTRGARHLRWEPDNALTLCGNSYEGSGCHPYFTAHPREFRRFIAEILGPDHRDRLLRMQADAERRGDSVDVERVIRGFRELDLTPVEMATYRSGAWLG